RDIFAPVAAEVAAGRVGPEEIGERVSELVPGWLEAPTESSHGQITGAVVTIDHFGNLITNIDGALLHSLARAQIKVAGVEIPLRRTYSDVRPGDYLALINSFGVLEIARAEQSAAEGLGLARGAPVVVSHK
ncbi:MAG TPA: SAM hydroxide adenosyltransferase, partial [Burkholderiales bacterium]|nr:SAM hydroxide adenosyltransferase [Burkholderiales bacterium]